MICGGVAPSRQESEEDLDSTQRFSSLGKPGGGKGTSFSGPWAAVARGSRPPEIVMTWQVGGPWGSCLGEGPEMLLWLERLSLLEWLFGEEEWGIRMGVSGSGCLSCGKCFRAT